MNGPFTPTRRRNAVIALRSALDILAEKGYISGDIVDGLIDSKNIIASTMASVTDPRAIPNELSILAYIHCGKCLDDPPSGLSPKDYSNIQVGFSQIGIQIYCHRHCCNVLHIDFQGQTHPSNGTAPR